VAFETSPSCLFFRFAVNERPAIRRHLHAAAREWWRSTAWRRSGSFGVTANRSIDFVTKFNGQCLTQLSPPAATVAHMGQEGQVTQCNRGLMLPLFRMKVRRYGR
jgi:hypothetical protein